MENAPYADILFFAIVAGFILYRLYTVLGRHDGQSPVGSDSLRNGAASNVQPIRPAAKEHKPSPAAVIIEQEDVSLDDAKLMQRVTKIKSIDPNFRLQDFMQGAVAAYEMVLKAFSEKDRDMLRTLLSSKIYGDFDAAVKQLEDEKLTEEITLIAINSHEVSDVSVRGNKAQIEVSFASEQVRLVRDAEGNIEDGDASEVETVEDSWVFEKDLRSPNPNWLVVET